MSLISSFSYRGWRSIHLTLVVIITLGLIFGRASLGPLIADLLLDTLYFPFYHFRAYVTDLAFVNDKNRALESQLTDMSLQLALYEEMARENDRLRQMLGFEPPPGYHLLPARVIAISGESLPVSAVINRGLRDLVRVDQPVISRRGLVGRVETVMSDHCQIQLLTDPRNRVAARVTASREMGVVRYFPAEGMMLANFPNRGIVEVGDTVISSGMGGIYPPGVHIGYVTEIERPANHPYAEIWLEPAANFHSIEQLFIMVSESGR
jgi:rod shape-determining protein MreC